MRHVAWILAVPMMASTGPIPLKCDRACLEGVMDSYIAAMVAHEPKKVPLSADLLYTENDQPLPVGEATWNPVGQRMSRQELIATADAYFSGLQKNDGKGVNGTGTYPFTNDATEWRTVRPPPTCRGPRMNRRTR